MNDVSLQSNAAIDRRYAKLMMDANRVVAGADPDFDEKIQAAQTIAMLTDPVIIYADEPPAALRTAVLRGVRALSARD